MIPRLFSSDRLPGFAFVQIQFACVNFGTASFKAHSTTLKPAFAIDFISFSSLLRSEATGYTSQSKQS
jgi:hypothetical protein